MLKEGVIEMTMQKGENHNHIRKGGTMTVSPIRDLEDIAKIKRLLADRPRDLALFTLWCNSNLRASDLVRIKAGDVRHLGPGDLLRLKEKKTGKARLIPLNKAVVEAIRGLLASERCEDSDFLFRTRNGPLSVPYVSMLVKGWCKAVGCNHGNYGSHSMRKTFGYHQRVTYNTPLPLLMVAFNHSSQQQTMDYLGIQPEEVRKIFLHEI